MNNEIGHSQTEWLSLLAGIRRIEGHESISTEASNRRFYRVLLADGGTEVAMVYPEPNPGEIDRITTLTDVYRKNQLTVPHIHERIGDRILLLEDAGDDLLETGFLRSAKTDRNELIDRLIGILLRLRAIDPGCTSTRLDAERMEREFSQFLDHFPPLFPQYPIDREDLAAALQSIMRTISTPSVFAHRDFHSRNILCRGNQLVLVDFQDSLLAPIHYDLVSLLFDSYLDWGKFRDRFIDRLGDTDFPFDPEQFRTMALQRNIKALGTFAFQIRVKNNHKYRLSIPLTIRYILEHLDRVSFSGKALLQKYFRRFNLSPSK